MNNTPSILYADCFSGISGDMFLAALLDAGLPLDVLQVGLDLLNLPGYELCPVEWLQGAIAARGLKVRIAALQKSRTWLEIKAMIAGSALTAGVKQRAQAIFKILAQAEARIHGQSANEVHFHEVGAVDSIVDIVGAAIGLEYFHIVRFTASALPMPSGWVECRHGRLPLPAPAVCEILKGVPVYGVNIRQELVTPTGAAIIKAMAVDFGPQPPMRPRDIGYGAGSRQLPEGQPNLLRLIIGEARQVPEAQEVVVMATNIDDWSPEGYPFLSARLLDAGALDVTLTPIQMKKGRPGFKIEVLTEPAAALALKDILLSETTAVGLRFRREERFTLVRESGWLPSSLGPIQAKRVTTPDGGSRISPEYEDCKRLAQRHQISLRAVYEEACQRSAADFRLEEAGE